MKKVLVLEDEANIRSFIGRLFYIITIKALRQ